VSDGAHFERFQTFLEEVWSKGNEELILDQLHGKATGLWPGEVDSEGFLQYYRALSRVLKDIRFEFTGWHEDDDDLWVSWVVHGRHWRIPEREIKWPGAASVKFQDQRIVEVHNYQDYMALFSQLELLPEQAFEDSLASVDLLKREPPTLKKETSLDSEFLWPGFRKVQSAERELYLPFTSRQVSLLKDRARFVLPTEEQLEIFFQSDTFSMVTVDSQDKILEADETFAELVDRLPESLPGLYFHQLLFPDDQCLERTLFLELAQGKHSQYRHRARLMRGRTVVWVQLSVARIESKEGDHRLVRAIQEASQVEELVAFQETERKMLSMELHDGLAQDLATLWIYLQTGRHKLEPAPVLMDRCLQVVEKMSDELRRRMKDLRSPILEGTALSVALESLATRSKRENGIPVTLVLDNEIDLVDQTVGLLVYRVVQEALRNVAEHSGASQCRVELGRDTNRLFGLIADDGVGFEPTEAAAKGRLGLLGMRDRCEMVGGSLELETQIGAGTVIRFEVQAGTLQPSVPGRLSQDEPTEKEGP